MKQANHHSPRKSGGSSAEADGIDFIGMLRRRKWRILLCTILAGITGYYYLIHQPPKYESSARLLVVKPQDRDQLPVQGVDGSQGYEEDVVTQSYVIGSPMIVEAAIESGELSSLPSLQYTANPTGVVVSGLSVAQPEWDANVLVLRYRSTHRADASQVLSAVIDSYQSHLTDSQKGAGKDLLKIVTEARDSLLEQMQKKSAEYRKFRETAPLVWTDGEGSNLHQERLSEIEEARVKLLVEQSETTSILKSIENARRRGGSLEAIRLMIREAELSQDGALAAVDEVFPLLLEEQLLLETHGEDHPKVQAVRKRIAFTRNYLGEAGDPENRPAAQTDFLVVFTNSLQEKLRAIETRKQELNALFEKEQQDAKALENFQYQDELYRAELTRLQNLFDSVVKRLEELRLIGDYGGYRAQVLAPPQHAVQVEPNPIRILSMAIVLGLIAGICWAYVAEQSDRRFRSSDDVRQELGMPVLGHVPQFRQSRLQLANDGSVGRMVVAYHQPQSKAAESFRGLRTGLSAGMRRGMSVFQVTSPDAGNGKSTVAANLSATLAQAGRRVLLIDADLRRPTLQELLGLDTSCGLAEALQGQPVDEVIQQTEINNLSAISAGELPPNPAELLSSPRLTEIIEELRARFDCVIFDTPPLLAVTDALIVGEQVDGLLMVLRLEKKTRRQATRAISQLDMVEVQPLGVVLNGVEAGRNDNSFTDYESYPSYASYPSSKSPNSVRPPQPVPAATAASGEGTA